MRSNQPSQRTHGDDLDRHEGLGVVAVDAQDRVVGAVDLLDVAGHEDVEVAVGVVVAPLRLAVLDGERCRGCPRRRRRRRRRCGSGG